MPRASPIRELSGQEPAPSELKDGVREFWNAEPCGTRYLGDDASFEEHRQARYRGEPYIHEFAGFAQSAGLRVLEIGVGMGADYLEWLKAGAHATGIDLSSSSLEQATRRCEAAGYSPDLRVADAERLPFPDNTFDVVYSYGVMHHSPKTQQCIREALRVLKPGAKLRIMIYRHPSLTGLMLWLRYGFLRGKSLRQTVYDFLESPGTKSYTPGEARELLYGFDDIELRQVFSPGDLLLHKPSAKFRGWGYSLVWKLYPRFLVRRLASNLGLFLLISARKPLS
jgi:ubiquinone/menaquinone biosynthesis C-methylase UbiE